MVILFTFYLLFQKKTSATAKNEATVAKNEATAAKNEPKEEKVHNKSFKFSIECHVIKQQDEIDKLLSQRKKLRRK